MTGITARIDRIKVLRGATRSVTPPVPRSAKLELTSRCDFRCYFCASHARPRARDDMPWERYARIARELRDLGVEQLGLFYLGESFLCEWLPEAVRYAKRDCGYPYVFVTTNGRLATPERVQGCLLAGLDSLKFSLNFDSPLQAGGVAGITTGYHRAAINNLKLARRVRDEVCAATGHRCGLYASSLLYDDAQPRRMRPVLDEIAPFVDEHYWLPLIGHSPPPSRDGGNPGVLTKPLPCWPLFTEAHVTSDGRLSACCFDHSARYSMGNLDETAFMDAWHGRDFRELRAAHLAGNVRGTVCEKCIGYASNDAKSRCPSRSGRS